MASVRSLFFPSHKNIATVQKEDGVSSHAEVNSVREAMIKWPNADPNDYLIYVNDTGSNVNVSTSKKLSIMIDRSIQKWYNKDSKEISADQYAGYKCLGRKFSADQYAGYKWLGRKAS